MLGRVTRAADVERLDDVLFGPGGQCVVRVSTPPPLDRRKRKSRAALQKALLDLLAEKPYAAITVDDIAARADVARATFYAHYHDKTALLLEATRELLGDLAVQVAAVVPHDRLVFSGDGVRVVFAHAQAHSALYRLILTGEGRPRGPSPHDRDLPLAHHRGVLTHRRGARGKPWPVSMTALVTAFVGASLLTLEALMLDELEGDVEERIVALVQSQAYGIAWSLDLEPDTVRDVGAAPSSSGGGDSSRE